MEHVREHEVTSRIKVSEAEIDALVEARQAASGAASEMDIAQILVTVPEGASAAVVEEKRQRALHALRRVRGGGEDFATVSRELSEDANHDAGGDIGMRPANRLPDLFVTAVRSFEGG